MQPDLPPADKTMMSGQGIHQKAQLRGFSPRPDYRPDIDGLRAIAVIAVLLSHLKAAHFGGGYIGVDIFFVISGYVIYGDYLRRVTTGPFAPMAFLWRRLRRLAPQLFLMLGAVLLVSALVLLPSDFQRLPARVLATALGLSNWLFAYQSDYFAPSSEWNVLLHSWTLSVEFQFYLAFPLLVLMLAKRGQSALPTGLAAIALGSLIYCLWPRAEGGAVYFDTLARAWEFLVGCLVQHLRVSTAGRRAATLISVFALAALGASISLFQRDGNYPDWRVLVPTLATAALIHFLPRSGIRHLFEARPAVITGRMSYSIYIWHWPLIVFAIYIWPGALENLGATLALTVIIIAVSWVAWRYVEEPLRRPATLAEPLFRRQFLVSLLALFAVAGAAWTLDGWPQRFDRKVANIEAYAADVNVRRDQCHRSSFEQLPLDQSCTYGAAGAPTIAIWSDSHGVELIAALAPWLAAHNKSAVQFSFSSCPPVAVTSANNDCERFNAAAFARLLSDRRITKVVLAGALDNPNYRHNTVWQRQFLLAAKALLAHGKQLVLVYPVPNQSFSVPRAMANAVRLSIPYEDARIQRIDYLNRTRAVFAVYASLGNKNVTRVYPDRIFCRTGVCEVAQRNKPLYFDDNHLSLFGAKQLAAAVTLGMDR